MNNTPSNQTDVAFDEPQCEEVYREGDEDAHLEEAFEDAITGDTDANTQDYEEPQGWGGDGSGLDDLADYNASEADDYRDE